ncbi:MAG: hypothetical protein SVW57_01250 [Thermodesulfobacteriota bacterium]|nr:hypothetical protein [Thermodesulfobacteriota bacterium]
MTSKKEKIREENEKIRRLRFIVDFSIAYLQQSQITLKEAMRVVEGVKRQALNLFPEKEDTFELIYRPRFRRIINERFQHK